MAKVIKLASVPTEAIINKIYIIRGQKVMIDRDLAHLYGVETKRLKEQVKRNLARFPSHFMFELTAQESKSLRSQNATLETSDRGAHSKYTSYAFTEHGVLMLSNVLKSKHAIEMSIKIIDIFVKLREMLLTHKDILLKLEQLEKKVTRNSEEIQTLFAAVKRLLIPPEQQERRRIGFRQRK
ncbi:ORF6N domain-containing protein [Puia sp.]|jgi:phage regulator Rha-like protein|uniref:ORF6N domain-containing protein n=1 Tax=Puia sp. TaxID=2045100 RepID=UPI002F3F53D9